MRVAMVLAAGHGTRLEPLTAELPKPLVPVGDRSVLEHIASRLASFGFDELVINTHHLEEKFRNQNRIEGVIIHRVHEPAIRGTAGGVHGARDRLVPGPVLVWNGDILTDPPVLALLDSARTRDIAFAVSPLPAGRGTVGVDAAGHVVRLCGERFGVESAGGDYVGVLALGPRALDRLPEIGCLVGDVALPLLREGAKLAAVPAPPFRDIGSLRGYLDANLDWLVARGGAGSSWVHPTARVAPAVSLSSSVVGAGAVVSGAGRFERCVAWPGARVTAPLTDAIVTTDGRVAHVSPA